MRELYQKLTGGGEPSAAAKTSAPISAVPPVDKIVATAKDWIGVPAQGGIDDPAPIVAAVSRTLDALNLPQHVLTTLTGDGGQRPVGIVVAIEGQRPGPTYVLNAVVDTAPADPKSDGWQTDPFAAHEANGWLYGRGAADSKTAGALFAHLGAELMQHRDQMQGKLLLFFDADEHSGKFYGVKSFVEHYPDVDGVMIGYTGHNSIKIGSRGFYRPHMLVHGYAQDIMLPDAEGPSSAVRASRLMIALSKAALPVETVDDFHLKPQIRPVIARTLPGAPGALQDVTELGFDIRTTPAFTAADAEALVKQAIADLDRDYPGPQPTTMQVHSTWPHFKTAPDHPMVRHLQHAANQHMPAARTRPISLQLTGPSNVGNYLAQYGISATSGFGLEGRSVHADNERVKIASIAPAYRSYRDGVAGMLGMTLAPEPVTEQQVRAQDKHAHPGTTSLRTGQAPQRGGPQP